MRLATPLAAAYVGLVVLANWLASRYTITVPLTHYLAPAGVLCIGAVLVFRDWLNQLTRTRSVFALMLVAGVASYLIGIAAGWTSLQKIAIASLVAFLVSETVELLVFLPARRRTLTGGVALSATVGNAIDSWLFLTLAFGSLAFFWGNFIGKLEMIAVGVALTACRRWLVPVTA
jgi:uncharacterized PurR-regulated membrane protein YhhQ (DUF165 family)